MQALALLPLLVASALAGDILAPALVEPIPQYTQEQNTATGEYGYSYHGGPSAKTEFRAPDGTTTGTYSYIDAHGILQTTSYIADEFGFRATGSNIPSEGAVPLDAPDVAAAKAAHLAEHSRATLEALSHHRKKRSLALAPALPIAHTAILPYATSSAHSFQIHHKTAHFIEPVIASHPALLYRKKRGIAYPAPLPYSSAKIYDELSRQPFIAAAPAAIAAPAPIAAHTTYTHLNAPIAAVAPAAIAHSLPLATSSQHRFQIHNSAKIIQEFHQPIYAAAPALPAALPAFGHETLLPAGPAALPAALPAAPIAGESLFADSDAIAVESA